MERSGHPATAGVLSAGGAGAVFARVYVRPVPQIVPADLRPLCEPVYDADGSLRDWSLNPLKVGLISLAGEPSPRQQFERWRAGYVTEQPLGDVAAVRAFLAWATDLTDVSALNALASIEVSIDPATATRVARQAQAAGAVCRALGQAGLGVSAAGKPGLRRGFVTGAAPVLVLAAGTSHVTAEIDHLHVVTSPHSSPFPAAVLDTPEHGHGTGTQTWAVTGWQMTGDGIVADTEDGAVLLGDSSGGRLLAAIAPGHARVSVAPAPLTSIFAGLLVHLPQLCQLAARSAATVSIGLG